MKAKQILHRAVFFIGWILSPLTAWNDIFINIPLSYVLASLYSRYFPGQFSAAIIAFYWTTNLFGLLMMYVSGREIFHKGRIVREIVNMAVVMVVYSLVIFLLNETGLVKPMIAK